MTDAILYVLLPLIILGGVGFLLILLSANDCAEDRQAGKGGDHAS